MLFRLIMVLFKRFDCWPLYSSVHYRLHYTGCWAHQNSHYGGNSEVYSHINKNLILLTEIKKKNECRTRSSLKDLSGCRT